MRVQPLASFLIPHCPSSTYPDFPYSESNLSYSDTATTKFLAASYLSKHLPELLQGLINTIDFVWSVALLHTRIYPSKARYTNRSFPPTDQQLCPEVIPVTLSSLVQRSASVATRVGRIHTQQAIQTTTRIHPGRPYRRSMISHRPQTPSMHGQLHILPPLHMPALSNSLSPSFLPQTASSYLTLSSEVARISRALSEAKSVHPWLAILTRVLSVQ